MKYYGNLQLTNKHKTGFLCSRKVPADIILKTYDWTIEQREKGVCVISGFHSKLEKDVFYYLSKGKQPIIVVLARGMYNRIPFIFKRLLNENRLLIISPFNDNIQRVTKETAFIRNKTIMELSDELVIPFYSINGMIDRLLKHYNDKIKISIGL